MLKVIYLTFTLLILICCKGKEGHNSNDIVVKQTEHPTDSSVFNGKNIGQEWILYNVSESPIVNLNKKTRGDIFRELEKVKIQISDKYITIKDSCFFELYKVELSPLEYWNSQSTVDIYIYELSKAKIKLKENIIIYKSLYPEKYCGYPSSEYFFTDSTLVFSYYGYLVFFQQKSKISFKGKSNSCYFNTKESVLPLEKNVINNNKNWNELECSILDLNSKTYIRLPNKDSVLVFIIADFNGDDEFYTLVTIKEGEIITKEKIGYTEDVNEKIRRVTEFEVNKDYVFTLTTKERRNNIWEIVKIESGSLDQHGLFSLL